MKAVKWALALSVGMALSQGSWAQFKNDEEAVKYRQGVFTAMKVHFGRLGAMVKGAVPFDAAVAKRDAQIVDMLSSMPWMGFTEGSDGISEHAKAEIWMESAKFQQGAKALQTKTADLSQAAQSASLDKIKAAFGAVGQSCKACHDNFKQ